MVTNTLVRACRVYVRPLLESNSSAWSPCLVKDIRMVASVQRRFTKSLHGMTSRSYADRRRALNRDSLGERRTCADLSPVHIVQLGQFKVDKGRYFERKGYTARRSHNSTVVFPLTCIDVRRNSYSIQTKPRDYSTQSSSTSNDMVPCPTLCFSLPGNAVVGAVTSFNNQLFVIRYETKQVEVYDSSTFKLRRLIEFPDDAGEYFCGLAVCSVNNCLYVSDYDKNEVYKVNLSASDCSTATKWSVGSGPMGLSVSKSHYLIVACNGADTVQQYTSTGQLECEIINVAGVRYAVDLNIATLVVSHAWYTINCVSVVSLLPDINGRRYPSTTDIYGSELISGPHSLAVDKNGFILVADNGNNRILVLNPELTDARTLPLTLDPPLENPVGLWFEEPRGRLYVGEQGGENRVLAFDNVHNVHTLFKE